MSPKIQTRNDRLIGVNRVTITFVSNFQEKAHSGLTTLMLNEKKRTQSNIDMMLKGQSTWMSCKTKVELFGIRWSKIITSTRTFNENNFWRKLDEMTKYLTVKWIVRLQHTATFQRYLLDCVNCGLETEDMRTAKIKQTDPTTASKAVVWVESGHLKHALFSL